MADAYNLRNVHFGYETKPIITAMDLSLSTGELTAIVGPNGSGKSTLLDIMAGYHQPWSGTVELFGSELETYPQRKLSRLAAMAPQEFGFRFPFTVREAVLMGRHPHIPRFSAPSPEDMEHVNAALRVMDLTGFENRPVPELSGGERQRTIMARTLAQQAPVMLLDEPTSNMDIRHALFTLRELKRLTSEESRTVITVLHDLNLAAAHADRIVLLRDGAVYSRGTVAETLTPENLRDVFGVHCAVKRDDFTDSLSVTYRLEQ